jgi:hypothetical protein
MNTMFLNPGNLTSRAPQDSLMPAAMLLLLLISGDLAFIFLHLLDVETGWMRGVKISLEADGGLPETFQYLKEFWMALCMAITFWRTRNQLYAAWSAVFAFLLLDDAGQVHERVGASLARTFELPAMFGLRSIDAGELIVAACVCLAMVAIVALTSWRRGEQSERISRDVLSLMCLLGVLGVAVDMLHVVTSLNGSLLAQVLLVVEDGGEMIVMSASTAYAFHVTCHQGRTRFDLWASARALAWTRVVAQPSHQRVTPTGSPISRASSRRAAVRRRLPATGT